MVPWRGYYKTYTRTDKTVQVASGDRIEAIGTGQITIECELPDGEMTTVSFENVLHVPQLATGLLSVNVLTDRGVKQWVAR